MSKDDGKINCNAMQTKFAKLKVIDEAGAIHSSEILPENGNRDESHIPRNARSKKARTPKIIFRQAQHLSKDEVYEICKAHGDVVCVRECIKSGFKFVELNSEAEMVAMHKKLKSTHHNLKICIDCKYEWNNKETENRTPRMSGENLPSSNVQEREHSGNPDTDGDEETKNFIKKMEQYKAAGQMSGTFSEEFIRNLKFGKCAQCDRDCHTKCNRCSTFYCGRECQRKAWPEHRLVCGIPKIYLAERSVVRTLNKSEENDHAEYLKPEHRNAWSATNSSEEAFAALRTFNASLAAKNYTGNGSERGIIVDRSTPWAANNCKKIESVIGDDRNTSGDGKNEDRSASGTANIYKVNSPAASAINENWNDSLAAKDYTGNGSERGIIVDRSTPWAAKNYKKIESVIGDDRNTSVDGKSEDRSASGTANNYKVNSPAASAINENWNDSLAAKDYTGNGSERGIIVDRSISWAANNYKADGRAAVAKNKESNGSWVGNNYEANKSEIGDDRNTSVDEKTEDRSASGTAINYKVNSPAASAITENWNASLAAKNYTGNGSERGVIVDCSTLWAAINYKADGRAAVAKNKESNGSWAANNYEASKSVIGDDRNTSVDGKSEDRGASGTANNYKVISPAASAINENWNDSLAAKNYTGNGSERGIIVDRSTSWAANNYEADGRAAVAKNKERNASWAANNYKTNESEIGVLDNDCKDDGFGEATFIVEAHINGIIEFP